MTHAIIADNLSKRYGRSPVLALDSVSLSVNGGEVYGFLGANGAGKSTMIRTLLNFIQPSSGSAAILGLDSVNDSVHIKRSVGYLAGEVALYKNMTGKQFLRYMSDIQPPKNKSYVHDLSRQFHAELTKPIHTLSKGNRQKLGLIQAFMHEPDVLILDEPTSGLDPLMQEEFFALIRHVRQRGACVFVSSHNFSEVQRMCDRIGFIREGKLVAEQTLSQLAEEASHTFGLTFRDLAPIKELRGLSNVDVTTHDKHHVTVTIHGELTPLLKVLAKHHVTRLQQEEVNLEQQFLRFYQEEKTT